MRPLFSILFFIESLRQLIAVDGDWVPAPENEKTLYFRPFEIAAENFLGVRAAHRAEYRVIASPVGPYFTGGVKPVSIWIALDSARAGKHGTGEAKTGGNYAALKTVVLRLCSWMLKLELTSKN